MRKFVLALAVVFLVAMSVNAFAENFAFGFSSFTPGNNLNVNGTAFYNIDSGWINSNGVHQANNTNYYSGFYDCGGTGVCKNYFVFDLTGLDAKKINTATFTVNTYSISVGGTYYIFGTNLSGPNVSSTNGFTSIPYYNRLTAGPIIGSIVLTPGMSNTNVTITLNHQGEQWVKSGEGSTAVLGGEFIPVGAVPEPGTLMLVGTGVVGLAGLLRRKFNH